MDYVGNGLTAHSLSHSATGFDGRGYCRRVADDLGTYAIEIIQFTLNNTNLGRLFHDVDSHQRGR